MPATGAAPTTSATSTTGPVPPTGAAPAPSTAPATSAKRDRRPTALTCACPERCASRVPIARADHQRRPPTPTTSASPTASAPPTTGAQPERRQARVLHRRQRLPPTPRRPRVPIPERRSKRRFRRSRAPIPSAEPGCRPLTPSPSAVPSADHGCRCRAPSAVHERHSRVPITMDATPPRRRELTSLHSHLQASERRACGGTTAEARRSASKQV